MPISYGRVSIQRVTNIEEESELTTDVVKTCFKCHQSIIKNDLLICVNPLCNIPCHIICFSHYFRSNDNSILPVEATCPSCGIQILWGDLVRKKKGCYKNLVENTSEELGFLD